MFTTDFDPPFSYSLNFRTWAGVAFFIFSIVFGVYLLFLPLYPILIIMVFSGGASCLFLVWQGFMARVRFAEFWNDRFTAKGRRFNKQFSYSDIRDVSLVRGAWPSTLVTISLKGEEEPLTLQNNPYSKLLDTDLYSWLKEKMNPSKNNQES